MNWNINFRRVENKTNLHINYIKDLNSKFCCIYPYFINVNLGPDVRTLLCDGEHIIDVSEWTGIGLSLSEEIDPSKEVRNLINKYIFEL